VTQEYEYYVTGLLQHVTKKNLHSNNWL